MSLCDQAVVCSVEILPEVHSKNCGTEYPIRSTRGSTCLPAILDRKSTQGERTGKLRATREAHDREVLPLDWTT